MSGRSLVDLPGPGGVMQRHELREARKWERPVRPIESRIAYAAAHVVPSLVADNVPGAPAVLDWDATLGFRRYLWSYGLAVAEAMDTAQRGLGLDWEAARELIHRSSEEARSCDGLIACGAGTDHAPADLRSFDEVIKAYLEQVEVVEDAGGQVILMASRQLARLGRGPDDYARVYGTILDQVADPVILHWLGPMFDPQLAGYWGSVDVNEATGTVLALIRQHATKVDGIKISLLDEQHETEFRRLLPEGVRLYTGNDFSYPELVRGDQDGHSHALLGIFDPIAPVASAALQALDRGDLNTYDALLEPTVPLARHLFQEPTYHYKTGVVFLAWLNGHQAGFQMVGGMTSNRSVLHLVETFRLADAAGLFTDPGLAAGRMKAFLQVAGLD